MNKAIKQITEKLDEIKINYEISNDINGIILSLSCETLGISIKFFIGTIELKDDFYIIQILTSELLKMKNENEVLKILNKINWESNFITYCANENKNVQIKFYFFYSIENLADNALEIIKEMLESLEKNYDTIMKANWS